MKQNVYDSLEFFERYSELPRSVRGLVGAPEWPALRALLPNLKDLRILDLGCGFGWFCRYAHESGASRVLGIDVSERMLARAREMNSASTIVYKHANLEHLDLPEGAFDVAFSSLALHYVEDLGALLANVYRALHTGGRLVVSMEHPIYMAPSRPKWFFDAEGRLMWPIEGYFSEGPRCTDWLVKGVIKQHRTLGTTLNLMIAAGLKIAHVEEWCPTEEQIAKMPEWAQERERPMFLLVAAER
jgi:ubiquinone/menaquinone biosynthesis C-methylase UbiE